MSCGFAKAVGEIFESQRRVRMGRVFGWKKATDL